MSATISKSMLRRAVSAINSSSVQRQLCTAATSQHRQTVATQQISSSPAARQKQSRCMSTAAATDAPALQHAPLSLAADELEMQSVVEQFVAAHLPPSLVSSMDEASELSRPLLAELFASGLMGIEIPAEYGGSGMTFASACVAIETLARTDAAVSVIVDVHNTLINTSFMTYGSEALKQKWLPRLATDTLGSFCLSESCSGSDAFALKTTATAQADGSYRLNGSKLWITNAQQAGVFIVFANSNPAAGYKGITAFVVAAGTAGLTVGKHEKKLGIRASSTCEIHLDNVIVSADSVLGTVGKGYAIAINSLNEGRIGIGSQMLGLSSGALAATLPYLWQRKQFGSFIGDFQAMQMQYAQLSVDVECSRLLVYNAIRLKQSGGDFVTAAAMAKLTASVTAQRVTSACIDLVGGVGFTRDWPLEKFYRDAKIGTIYEGTSILQLATIAKAIAKEHKPAA